ncbi:unnamed protein product [Coffea canephora]|uniref:DH200=94 genomic scaffold, scaffold_2726 n=1 Tax=Coffea canephora TaxID=49390 RepID=A0A068VK91_COFCA|nr:unnamed protein product [Coffea canephora]
MLKYLVFLPIDGQAEFKVSRSSKNFFCLCHYCLLHCYHFQDGDAVLRFSKPNKCWVESSQKRYVPCAGDTVLGIVVDSRSDNFLVDIKGPTLAFLPVLAFEGGTRRNIPKFEV